jgi:hypothetical protein
VREANNQQSMTNFDQAQHKEDNEPNKCHHARYQQMAIIINDGPTSHGTRLKLPSCVLSGVWVLFPDPESIYAGHQEIE